MNKLKDRLLTWFRRVFKRQLPPIRLEECIRFEPRQRHTQTFLGSTQSIILRDEGLTPAHEKMLLQECGRLITQKMIDAGALTYRVIPSAASLFNEQWIEVRAVVEVVMPEKDEEAEKNATV
jgi:hypothetical protein